jgi:hypothetical protein
MGAAAQALRPEEQLQAIRQSLVQAALSGPTEVRATSWVDGQGVLHDSSSFASGVVVRGVRVLAYNKPLNQEPIAALHLDHQQAVGTQLACRSTAHDRAQPWHQMQLDIQLSPHLPIALRQSAHQSAQVIRQWLRQRSANGALWRVVEPYQPTTRYEQALLSRGEQHIPWRLTLRLEPGQDAYGTTTAVLMRWDVSRRLDRVVLHQQQQSLNIELPELSGVPQRLSSSMQEQLQFLLQSFAHGLESKLACIPPQFEVLTSSANSLRIAGGEMSGLRVGDQLIVADRHKLPSRSLEAKALDQLALAEVQSVSGYYAELKQIAGPKLSGAAQWVAVPYSP